MEGVQCPYGMKVAQVIWRARECASLRTMINDGQMREVGKEAGGEEACFYEEAVPTILEGTIRGVR